MSGQFWTQQEERTLLQIHTSVPDPTPEETISVYARQSGRTHNAVRMKLRALLEQPIPSSRYKDWNQPPVVHGDVLIMGDLHIPYHDADFIARCLKVAKRWGVTQAVIGGDALDARAFSHWGDDFEDENRTILSSAGREILEEFAEELPNKYRDKLYDRLADMEAETGNIGEEIKQVRAVLKALDTHFDNVLWIMGNHETWVLRTLKKAMPAAEFGVLFGVDNPRWTISPYYWSKLESGGELFQIEHPKFAGKGSSKKLTAKFTCNIIMLHNHHLSVQSDPSGKFIAIESGMCADVAKIQFENQRHSSADEHITGAVIVRNGKAHLLNRFTDWGFLLK